MAWNMADIKSVYSCKQNQLSAQFFLYVYFYSLHVSGNYVPIIRRNYCISATPGICHSVRVTVWYAGWDKKINSVYRAYFTADGG